METFNFTKKNIISLIIAVLIACFICPFLSFWIGYFIGWITEITIGGFIIEGFAIFNIDISIDQIPLITGFISWIAMLLKGINLSSRNKES